VIGRLMTMTAHPGRGPELAALLLRVAESLRGFPGCELYAVAHDTADPDTVHVTELWRDEAAARAALTTPPDGSSPSSSPAPSPADVMALLSAPPSRTDLTVLGGVGLP
jgi:quinol monooxygenase YgiN